TFAAPLLVSTLSALLPFLLPARPSSRASPKDPPHMLPPPVEPRPSLSAARAAARTSARAAAAAAVAASPEGAESSAGASSVSDYSLDGSPAASDTASSASPPSSRPSTPPPRAAVLPALPSPPSPELSPADQVLIQDVRSALEDADVDTQDWLTDDTVLRYAVPGKRHVATMVNRIRATATWRRSFRLLAPAEVLCSPWRPFGYWHGADVDGRPCLVLHVGRAAKAIPSASHADFVCYLASLVSAVTAALTLSCPDSGRIAVILDCQGAPALWRLPVGMLRATITALHRNFPHRMARLHVLHLPASLRLLARAMLQVGDGGVGGGGWGWWRWGMGVVEVGDGGGGGGGWGWWRWGMGVVEVGDGGGGGGGWGWWRWGMGVLEVGDGGVGGGGWGCWRWGMGVVEVGDGGGGGGGWGCWRWGMGVLEMGDGGVGGGGWGCWRWGMGVLEVGRGDDVARLAGGCICAVCCEEEAEGEAEGRGGPWAEQRHGESGGEAGAAAQAGTAAEAARGASLSGPSDSLPLEHPCNGMIDPATCLSSPVLPSTPQQHSPQQTPPRHASPQLSSPMRARRRSPLVCALRSDRGRVVSHGVEWAERRWLSRHVVWRMLLLLLMALTLTALCLCSAAAMASYSY
ncbi:unnamed protein product, partial [Closterium sp. Naga37s-1]